MEGNEASTSQQSEHSNVLDLSFTYDRKTSIVPKPDNYRRTNEIAGFGPLFESPPFSIQVNGNLMSSAQITSEVNDDNLNELLLKSNTKDQVIGNTYQTGFCSYNRKVLSTGEEESSSVNQSIRNSLDMFYNQYCQMKPADEDQYSKSVLDFLSSRISDLTAKNTNKYGLRSLQMAHIILNRDGCEAFKRSSKTVNFPSLANPKMPFESGKVTPGISKHVLTVLLKEHNNLSV
ncbi:shieldin complex subunit 1 [Pleurodeles waltl]|uniref:shieldin complex subunit 1 n=1 Tax=Pleurodeles waltl TaxID=8319 RepID=UPI003709BD65